MIEPGDVVQVTADWPGAPSKKQRFTVVEIQGDTALCRDEESAFRSFYLNEVAKPKAKKRKQSRRGAADVV